MEKIKEETLNTPDQPTMEIKDMGDGRSRLRVQFDITYKGHKGKDQIGESMTEPDMTLRLGQLLEQHSRGRDIPMKTPLFFDTEIPTFSDLTDVDRYREQLQRRLDETDKFILDEKIAAKQEKEHLEHEEKLKTARDKKGSQHDHKKPLKEGSQMEITDDPNYKPKQ